LFRRFLGQIGKPSMQFSLLAEHERAEVGARQAGGPLDRDDLRDLIQAEAEPSGLPDEREQVQRGLAVDPVARGGAAGGKAESGAHPPGVRGTGLNRRHQDFQVLVGTGPSVTIGRYMEASQALAGISGSVCSRSRPMVPDGSDTILTQTTHSISRTLLTCSAPPGTLVTTP
jgi:hypothetical protein